MAYKDTIGEVVQLNGTILVPALCDIKRKAEAKVVHAAGKREPYGIYSGARDISGSIKEFPLGYGMSNILELILSDEDGTLQEITVDDGNAEYVGYPTSLKISVPVNDTATCSIDFVAKSEGESKLTKSDITIDAYLGQNVALTGIPSTFDFESVDLTVTNKVTAKYTAKGTDQLPSHLSPGYLDISFNIKYQEDPGVDILEAITAIATATIKLKSIAGKFLTITLTNVVPEENNRNMNAEDIVDFGLAYKATGVSFGEA